MYVINLYQILDQLHEIVSEFLCGNFVVTLYTNIFFSVKSLSTSYKIFSSVSNYFNLIQRRIGRILLLFLKKASTSVESKKYYMCVQKYYFENGNLFPITCCCYQPSSSGE